MLTRLLWLTILMALSCMTHAKDGMYLWKSEVIQDKAGQDRLLDSLHQHGVSRLYFGLNAQQAKGDRAFTMHLGKFIAKAQSRGIDVWLLLGDPGWLNPSERHKLVSIVKRFEEIPFAGVLLDLEVEQVEFPVRPEVLVQWVDTVEAVISSTQKHVSLASHWRWFSPDLPICMGCEFSRLGVHDISLMVYTTNIDRAVKITQNSSSAKGMPIRLAQSIEPTLSTDESWAKVPPSQRRLRLSQLKARLDGTPIDWQAYEFINHLD